MHRDDDGAFLVFEAVLVAVFIFTAILFVTSIQRPTADLERSDVSLAVVAADTLQVLEDRGPLNSTRYDNRLIEIVDLAMKGNGSEAHALIKEVLPEQTRYVLRLNNGITDLHLLPVGSGLQVQPRGAQGAEVFIMPNWTAYEGNTISQTVYPGQRVVDGEYAYKMTKSGSPNCILSPAGTEYRPGPQGAGGTSWVSQWRTTLGQVPLDIPYGVWLGQGGAPCVGQEGYVRVVLPPGNTVTDRPVYGVQLVVWRAA